MSESHLCLHAGAREVTLEELREVKTPPATSTWFPVGHGEAADTVSGALADAGFQVSKARYALSRNNERLFATLDLSAPLAHGVSLSIGVRNSTDKSLPLGFAAGSRVFLCDNLAMRADLLVARKHTRFGQKRFREAICKAVGNLHAFQEAESRRITRFMNTEVNDGHAESMMLKAFEQGIVSAPLLPKVIHEWREPSYEAFQVKTLWSLFNCFTTVLGQTRALSNPQRFAGLTMRLSGLFGHQADEAVTLA
jgi:hypothetical protein